MDTMRAEVARAAVDAGAVLVNDVSGGLADEAMVETVAGLGVPYVCTHWRGPSADMQRRASYDDVVAEVIAELGRRIERCRAGGVALEQLILDPGFGFAKTAEHNWELLQRLDELGALDRPDPGRRVPQELPRARCSELPIDRGRRSSATMPRSPSPPGWRTEGLGGAGAHRSAASRRNCRRIAARGALIGPVCPPRELLRVGFS